MKRLIVLVCLACLANLLPLRAHAELPDATRFSVKLELGDVSQARDWLDEGLDPNFEGKMIGTGLMIGAWIGSVPLMDLFLKRGADIHRVNRFGETALMLAAWKNQRTAMRWLLDHGATPKRPERNWTALHYAAFAGNAELVDALVAAGADVNARSTNGSTVVMMAAREGHPQVAKKLLAAGANPALKNDYGDNAVAWAMKQGNFDIAKSFTSAENYAELVRAAAANPLPPPQRSMPAPDLVEEQLRMARLAEASGNRDAALAAYRKAWAALKAQESPKKVGADGTAKTNKLIPKSMPKALVIRAKRSQPDKQSISFVYASDDVTDLDQLLASARAADAAGRRQEAIRLFREVAARIKASAQ